MRKSQTGRGLSVGGGADNGPKVGSQTALNDRTVGGSAAF